MQQPSLFTHLFYTPYQHLSLPFAVCLLLFAFCLSPFSSIFILMKFLGNILWLIFGGFIIAIEYFVASFLLIITIVGIPFGVQTLKLGMMALWPFGQTSRSGYRSSGCLYVLMNIIWIFVGGIWIALSHLAFGLLWCITIVGIPFGMQHFKLAGVALTPFGRDIVNS